MRDLTHAYKTLEYLREHPETHNQAEWRCKTGMCFAGWYVALHPNARYVYELDSVSDPSNLKYLVRTKENCIEDLWNFVQDDMHISVIQADRLFFGAETTDDLAKVLDNLSYTDDLAKVLDNLGYSS